jgi:sugar diacid utilization regulator
MIGELAYGDSVGGGEQLLNADQAVKPASLVDHHDVARSYEEAREALTMAGRLRVDTPVVNAHDLLIYRVLLRDQPAIVDLVNAVLSPLLQARGGAQPLLATLEAYFDTGAVATESAKRLHVSVRAVTYRLNRVKTLTGYNPG